MKCACGHVMVAPAGLAEDGDDDLYEVVDDAPRAGATTAAAASPPVIPVARPMSYARRETVAEPVTDQYFPDRVKDLYAPLAMIAVGTIIELSLAMFGRSRSLAYAMTSVGVFLVANTIIMLLTVMVVAKVRSISFGPVPTAIIKLCGLSIGPGAVGSLLSLIFAWIPFLGALGGWLAGCILYFACFGALFDLDEPDTWAVVLSVVFVRIALFIAIMIIVA